MTETGRRGDVRARAVFGHRVLATAARAAVVVLAFFLIIPALVVVIGLPMQVAVGTSLLIITLNAAWGVLGNLQLGTLDWTLALLFALGGVGGVLAGGKLAGRLPDRVLRTGRGGHRRVRAGPDRRSGPARPKRAWADR